VKTREHEVEINEAERVGWLIVLVGFGLCLVMDGYDWLANKFSRADKPFPTTSVGNVSVRDGRQQEWRVQNEE
jgi:hypothetical protein